MEKHSCIKEVRGIGFMQGMELTIPVGNVVADCLKKGLIVISASGNVIRFVPPLVIEKEHIDTMIRILDEVLPA